MNFKVITIFPDLITQFAGHGLLGKAVREGLITLEAINLREYAVNTQGQVDDTPFGGGSGMVMRPEPAFSAIDKIKAQHPDAKVIYFTPRGKQFGQADARRLANSSPTTQCSEKTSANSASDKTQPTYIILCSRYEGADQRIIDELVDEEFSIGDYVLMGGETPAFVLLEAVVRLLPGVLGNPESTVQESFSHCLLEHPQYTKPREYSGLAVPEVLFGGNHAEIARWQKNQAVNDTLIRRPELITKALKPKAPFYLALIHHPVYDKQGDVIISSITNLDLHDIARSCKTFAVDRYYVAHPTKALRLLALKILGHWEHGYGLTYNPNRSEALETISIVTDLDDAILAIEEKHKMLPRIIATSARRGPHSTTFTEMRARLCLSDEPHLMLLGTGWGLTEEITSRADYMLEPVDGRGDYNHLSVRAAAAIMLSRLLG